MFDKETVIGILITILVAGGFIYVVENTVGKITNDLEIKREELEEEIREEIKIESELARNNIEAINKKEVLSEVTLNEYYKRTGEYKTLIVYEGVTRKYDSVDIYDSLLGKNEISAYIHTFKNKITNDEFELLTINNTLLEEDYYRIYYDYFNDLIK